jgi:hypothetical protein
MDVTAGSDFRERKNKGKRKKTVSGTSAYVPCVRASDKRTAVVI